MVLVLFLVLGPDAGVSVPLCWGGDLALAAYQSYSTTGPRLLGWAGLGWAGAHKGGNEGWGL